MSVPRKKSPKSGSRSRSKKPPKLYPEVKINARIPRQLESAASLWLDFFQQFCDLVIDRDGLENPSRDRLTLERARILADRALETFQERFPGVHP